MSKKDKLLSAYFKNMSDEELIKTTRDIYCESNIGGGVILANLSFLSIFIFPYLIYRLIKYNWYWMYVYPTMSILALILVIALFLIIEYCILRFTGSSFNKLSDYQQPLKEKFIEAKEELEYRNYNVEIIKQHNLRTQSTRYRLVIKKNENEK